MDTFLSTSKAAVLKLSIGEGSKRIRIVLGNETCDLDSAISALIQAFSEHLDGLKKGGPKFVVIPLMNISKREYFLRTEVVFYLMQHNITSNLLTFRDQIDLEDLTKNVKKKVEVILVDHHTLPDEDAFLLDSVVKIIDHRPQEPGWLWPDRETHMEIVGSCATLVARNFCDKHPEAVDSRISRLLLGPILVDTFNLSAEAGRAKNEDFQIVSKLESIAFPQVADKGARTAELFHEIIEAKSDISKLTTDDLLIKDLKITAGVPIVGLPILVENFVRLPDSLKALWNFAKSRKAKVVVLMGLEVNSGKLSRDIAVSSFLPYSKDSQDISSYNLRCKIVKTLMESTEPCLELKLIRQISELQVPGWNVLHGSLSVVVYTMGNVHVSRKQVLPIIRDLVVATGYQATRERFHEVEPGKEG